MLKITLTFVSLLLILLSCSQQKTPDINNPIPIRPSNFKAVVLGPKSIQLSWSNPDDTRFERVSIARSTSSHPNTLKEGTLIYNGKAQTFIDDRLNPGTRYYYSIFALNSSGDASPRLSINAMPFDLTLVQNVTVNNELNQIKLNWKAPADIYYNKVQIQRSSTSYPKSINDGQTVYQGNTLSFTDTTATGLSCGKNKYYYYTIFSLNQNSQPSLHGVETRGFAWCAGDVPVHLELISTAQDSIHKGNVIIQIKAETLDSGGISKVEFFKTEPDDTRDGLFTDKSASIYEYIWNSDSASEGENTVWVQAVNSMGVKENISLKLMIDRTAPTLDFSSPNPNQTYMGTILIKANAHDNIALKKVELKIGSRSKIDLQAPYEFNWDTTSEDLEGKQTFTLTAFDKAGNKSVKSIEVNINNPPRVVNTGPAHKSIDVSYTGGGISAQFSEAMKAESFNNSTFFVKEKESNTLINGSIAYISQHKKALWNGKLKPNTTYIVTVKNQVKDLISETTMTYDYVWEFTTGESSNLFDDPKAIFDSSTFGE